MIGGRGAGCEFSVSVDEGLGAVCATEAEFVGEGVGNGMAADVGKSVCASDVLHTKGTCSRDRGEPHRRKFWTQRPSFDADAQHA
jgi:hypothetical protein